MTSNPMPDWAVLDWPAVSAVVRPDGTAEVTIGGTSTQINAADDVATARTKVTAYILTHTAAQLGRPVRVHTSDPDGDWWVLVHPDGTVSATDPPAITPSALLTYPSSTPPAPRRTLLPRRSRRRNNTKTSAVSAAARRSLPGHRLIALTNPRGGTYTTTSVLQLAEALAGHHRILAWDTTLDGSLAQRATQVPGHTATTSDLHTDLARDATARSCTWTTTSTPNRPAMTSSPAPTGASTSPLPPAPCGATTS